MAGQGVLSKCILIAVDQVNAVYENVECYVIPCEAYTLGSVVYVLTYSHATHCHMIPCDAYTWASIVYIIAHSRGNYKPLIVPLPVDKIHYKYISRNDQ